MYMEDVLLTFILFSNLATSGNTYTTINPITILIKVNINLKAVLNISFDIKLHI